MTVPGPAPRPLPPDGTHPTGERRGPAAPGLRIGVVASFGTAHEVVGLARTAEESGWDGFFTWDGLSIMAVDTFDPWSILAGAALCTERIVLGALVFALPRRRPWEVARQAVTVDHLSNGRLVLPVGVGVTEDGGFSAVPGQPIALRERAEHLDDALAFLAEAWRGEPFSFAGTHLRTDELLFLPRPVERPGHGRRVPVWPVGVWNAGEPPLRSLRRAIGADGVVVQLRGERAMDTPRPEDVAGLTAWVREHRAADAGAFDVVVQGVLPADRAEAEDFLAGLESAGATWWVESHWDPETTTPEMLADLVARGPVRPRAG